MSAYSQFGYSYAPASQLLVAGQPPTSPPGGGSTPTASSCCESGRPIMTDPVTGQTVCSCQYDPARLALSSYQRLGGSVYGTAYPSTDQNPYPSIGVDSSAFYSPLSNPYALKEGGSSAEVGAWTGASLQPTTGYYPYDPTLAAYGYSAGYDLAARRKNATRESTATLKAWLNEHKKNPYPTKGEKIMLAIITKMTLTQVSTWFANARRRLKKENKMTWEPKNKTDDDDDAIVSDNDNDDKEKDDDKDIRNIKLEDKDLLDVKSEQDRDESEDEDDDEPKNLVDHNSMNSLHCSSATSPCAILKEDDKSVVHNGVSIECGVPLPATKPKIWSLADTAACKTPPPSAQLHSQPWIPSVNSFALPTAMSPTTPYAPRYGGGGGLLSSSSSSSYGSPTGSGSSGTCAVPPTGGATTSSSTSGSGFPEVQTDTPPQTPPNMKLPSVASNLLSGTSCFSSSHYGSTGQSFLSNIGGRIQSSQKERKDLSVGPYQNSNSAVMSSVPHQTSTEGTAFKPFYKSSSSLGSFVSPV